VMEASRLRSASTRIKPEAAPAAIAPVPNGMTRKVAPEAALVGGGAQTVR
jgi:hypothetical protein